MYKNWVFRIHVQEKTMPIAVGALETRGFPAVMAAADAMVKAGRVTLVGYIRAGSARFTIMIRGDVSEVKQAMDAGIEAAKNTPGGALETWVIIPRPHENVEVVLPIAIGEDVERFHASLDGHSLPVGP